MLFDSKAFKNKPNGEKEIGGVNWRINNEPEQVPATLPLSKQLKFIIPRIERGQSFVLDEFEGKRLKANYAGSYWIGIDVDEHLKFEEVSTILDNNGIDWCLRYKTFNHSDKKDKFRYLIKVDRLLDQKEAMLFYKYLETLMPLDTNATDIARLWFGTKHEIDAYEDVFCREVNYAELYEKRLKSLENSLKREMRELDQAKRIKKEIKIDKSNAQEQDFMEYMEREVNKLLPLEVGRYEPLVILGMTARELGLSDVFLDLVEDYENFEGLKRYVESDFVKREVYELLAEFDYKVETKIEGHKFTDVFDIIADAEERFIDNFISEESNVFEEIETNGYKSTLITASAGSGKTHAFVEYAKNSKTNVKKFFLVPTLAILEDQKKKLSETEGWVFLSGGEVYDGKSKNIMSTYDQYFHYTNEKAKRNVINVIGEHLLFVDEAHELYSFANIHYKKKNAINEIVRNFTNNEHNSDIKAITFLTATPFNLPYNYFDKKIVYKYKAPKLNKDIEVVEVETEREKLNANRIIEICESHNKTLIYLDSKTKQKALTEILHRHSIGLINSENKDGITETIENNDIIFCTKKMLIGVDVQGKFDAIIYLERKDNINAIMQLLNRERQKANYFIFLTKTKVYDTCFNTSKEREEDLLANFELTTRDKNKLNNVYFDNEICQLYSLGKAFEHLSVDTELVKECLAYFYKGDEIGIKVSEIVLEKELQIKPMQHKKILKEVFDFNNQEYSMPGMTKTETLEGLLFGGYEFYKAFGAEHKLKKETTRILTSILKAFNKQNITDIEECKGRDFLALAVPIKNYDKEEFNEYIEELSKNDVITAKTKAQAISKFNAMGFMPNGKQWNDRNFQNNLFNYCGLKYNRKNKKVNGSVVKVLNKATF